MITDLFSLPTFQPTQSLSHTNNNGDGDDEQLTLLTYLLVTYYVVADEKNHRRFLDFGPVIHNIYKVLASIKGLVLRDEIPQHPPYRLTWLPELVEFVELDF
ncbi:hypothetical protein HUJ04_000981 [Dendroctonus ponderosae]|nr:hypothetical protein HUJ04_000981 [Dendroctonus ponderosae]